jgi:hypothetical protein
VKTIDVMKPRVYYPDGTWTQGGTSQQDEPFLYQSFNSDGAHVRVNGDPNKDESKPDINGNYSPFQIWIYGHKVPSRYTLGEIRGMGENLIKAANAIEAWEKEPKTPFEAIKERIALGSIPLTSGQLYAIEATLKEYEFNRKE